jgi:hypothetical protein
MSANPGSLNFPKPSGPIKAWTGVAFTYMACEVNCAENKKNTT